MVNDAEDSVFGPFCQKIGVENIREYEERQLKVAQEESQARLRFDTQIARLTHQCASHYVLRNDLRSFTDTVLQLGSLLNPKVSATHANAFNDSTKLSKPSVSTSKIWKRKKRFCRKN